VREISRCMLTINRIPASLSREVVSEFQKVQKEQTAIYVKGTDFVRKALNGSSNKLRGARLMEQITYGIESRPLETIAMMPPQVVASLIENEHPQTVAVILSTQQVEHAANILNFMPDALKADVMYRIAKIDRISPAIISQIEEALEHEIGIVAHREHEQQIGGIDKVVDIINSMTQGADRSILSYIEETDQDMAEEIRNSMFTFEDLANLPGRTMQIVLREVTNNQLTLALKSASESMKNFIFQNISERAAEMIQEDLEAMGPVKLSEVESTQQAVVKIALRLEDEGKIVIPGRGGAQDAFV
jgi:flagellar motor switch protein FliG